MFRDNTKVVKIGDCRIGGDLSRVVIFRIMTTEANRNEAQQAAFVTHFP